MEPAPADDPMRPGLRFSIFVFVTALCFSTQLSAAELTVVGKVADENGVAVPFARRTTLQELFGVRTGRMEDDAEVIFITGTAVGCESRSG